MESIQKIRITCTITAFISLILIGLGGYVRATGAGLACPDWPLCFGKIVPEFGLGVMQEYLHRVLAGLVALLTIYLVIIGYKYKHIHPKFYRLAVFLFILVIIQAVFGGLTVIMKLNPFIVTAHFLLGSIFFIALSLPIFERLKIGRQFVQANKMWLRVFVLLMFIAVLFQSVLGAFVGSSGAALACPDLPFCLGEIIPENASGPQIIHMTHRIFGLSILLLSSVLVLISRVFYKLSQLEKGLFSWILFLISFQVFLGIANVWLKIPISGTVLHLIVAEMILLGLVLLYKELHGGISIFSEVVVQTNPFRHSSKALSEPQRKMTKKMAVGE
jgi:heme a synthase